MILFVPARAVVSQFYVTEAENEYVIRANSAIMKCKIPSFVSEFVQVDQWVADDGTVYTGGEDYGRLMDGVRIFLLFSRRLIVKEKRRREKRLVSVPQ